MNDTLRRRLPSDISKVLVLRIAGAYEHERNVRYRTVPVLICLIVAAFLISWSVFVATREDPSHEPFTRFLPWCFYYIMIAGSLIFLMNAFGQLFLRISGPIDQILTRHGRSDYDLWARKALHVVPQASAGLAVAVGAPFALGTLQSIAGSSSSVLVLPPSYAIVSRCRLHNRPHSLLGNRTRCVGERPDATS